MSNDTATTGTKKKPTLTNNSRGVSTLLYCCQQGDVDRVRLILRAQPNALQERDRTGKNALHYCCTSDKITAPQAADVLVMAAPDLMESRDEDGFTPLHLAVIAGNMPLITFLLANNADVNAVDNEKHTVVHWATVCGETVALQAVLAAGAPVSTPDVHGGYPLHYASQMCGGEKDTLGLQVLNCLLSHQDISVTVEDGDGRQPLLWAASAGSAKAMLALIRAGSAVESHDKDGLTALHCSASRGHTDCIDTLLTLCGALPDVIDTNGCTALHYAVTLGHADATSLLLTHSANPNRQDRKGRSPAHCGCAKGQFETVKILGSHEANLWLRNARGDLPLHEAAASGRRDLVKWLLEARPSQVNARNNDGRCPLHLAALNDNTDMCKILLDAGAQINPVLRTSKNILMTPLDCALQRGFRTTAKYLQLHGGVPANRLTGLPQSLAKESASSLQIRDDVTLWGGSSSDSEREEVDRSKSKRRIYKRKLSYKYERKKEPLSVSDYENGKVIMEQLPPGKIYKNKDKNGNISDQGSVLAPKQGEIYIYTNEVNINDKNGNIRIHQNSKIEVDDLVKLTKQMDTEISQQSNNNGEHLKVTKSTNKRPKSAKHARASSKTPNGKKQSPTQMGSSSDSQNNSKTKGKVKNNKTQKAELAASNGEKSNQQSARSNTSHEDGEGHEELIVEASIHLPPKEVNDNSIEVVKSEKEVVETVIMVEGPSPDIANDEELDANLNNVEDQIVEAKDVQESKSVETVITETNLETTESAPVLESEVEQNLIQGSSSSLPEENVVVSDEAIKVEEAEVPLVIQEESKVAATEVQGVPVVSKKDEESSNVQEHKAEESSKVQPSDPIIVPEDNKKVETVQEIKASPPTKKDSPQTKSETSSKHKAKPKAEKKHPKRKPEKAIIQVEKLEKLKEVKRLPDSSLSVRSSEESEEDRNSSSQSSNLSDSHKSHRSFQILDDNGEQQTEISKQRRRQKSQLKKQRSRSEESRITKKADPANYNDHERLRRSKIPTPVIFSRQSSLSRSDKYLNLQESKFDSNLGGKVPSLPNINNSHEGLKHPPRSISNSSAPIGGFVYSDRESASDVEEISSATRKKRLKKRSKNRESKSAGSDYESSNLIDSGFEPSPRSTRIPKWRNMSERGVNMSSVTQTIQSNIRRYHLERKIFQHLLELKRLQIRSGQHNEAVLVKRAIDAYHRSCAATVGAGRYVSDDLSFKNFEHFLYSSLRKIQKSGFEHLNGLPEAPRNPLFCTQKTHRCDHATHAYTGVPCAAYLPKIDHHTIPKIGFDCKPSGGFLPKITKKNAVTLELCHGKDKQVISLPAERLNQNKRYYVTFTVKGNENNSSMSTEEINLKENSVGHTHSKSD